MPPPDPLILKDSFRADARGHTPPGVAFFEKQSLSPGSLYARRKRRL